MDRLRYLLLAGALAVVVAAMTAGSAVAAKGGNSANAHLCQNGGWQTLVTPTGGTFADEAACVSYGAHGGTVVQFAGEAACADAGGTFVLGSVQTDDSRDLWHCNRYPVSPNDSFPLALYNACSADAGTTTGLYISVTNFDGTRSDTCKIFPGH